MTYMCTCSCHTPCCMCCVYNQGSGHCTCCTLGATLQNRTNQLYIYICTTTAAAQHAVKMRLLYLVPYASCCLAASGPCTRSCTLPVYKNNAGCMDQPADLPCAQLSNVFLVYHHNVVGIPRSAACHSPPQDRLKQMSQCTDGNVRITVQRCSTSLDRLPLILHSPVSQHDPSFHSY